MNYFSRKPSSYASDANTHKPVGLFYCSVCGASVTENSKTQHEAWHEQQEQKIRDLENRQPIVINNPPYVQPTTYPYYPIYNPPYSPTYPTITWSTSTLGGNISGSTTYSNISNVPWNNDGASGNFLVEGNSGDDEEDGEAGSLV